ncbi:molybdopterin cofactor-binding domain-containing protein [Candidatus Spongiisocius sp.]|uniref:molybdopterin cofactor-binding domain-containing protein n=1 Tax=Candidatus Spongiisocius sp. TaxID=3101273 RepID=UPI003B5908FE
MEGETGKVMILDFVSVDDYGVGINPGIVDGQIHGGIAQGIGQALYEQVSHDECGQVPSASFAAYLLPSAMGGPATDLGQHGLAFGHPSGSARGRGVGHPRLAARHRQRGSRRSGSLRSPDRPDPLRPDVVWELLHPE